MKVCTNICYGPDMYRKILVLKKYFFTEDEIVLMVSSRVKLACGLSTLRNVDLPRPRIINFIDSIYHQA